MSELVWFIETNVPVRPFYISQFTTLSGLQDIPIPLRCARLMYGDESIEPVIIDLALQ